MLQQQAVSNCNHEFDSMLLKIFYVTNVHTLAVSGKRGSGADGGGGSLGLVAFTPSDLVLDANLPNSQPIFNGLVCVAHFSIDNKQFDS